MTTSSKGWALVMHSHDGLRAIDARLALAALPPEIVAGERTQAKIRGTVSLANRPDVDWAELQREQADLYERELAPLRNDAQGIAYFGSALIPLTIDLGFYLQKWATVRPFQYHQASKSWCWPVKEDGRQPLVVEPEHNLPGKPSKATGPVVLRVSVSSRVSDEDTRLSVPSPSAEIDIDLGSACGHDAIQCPEDVEAVAGAFEKALYLVHQQMPCAGPVHLFAAVPSCVAFAMGTRINATVHPLIQTYDYQKSWAPPYREALVVGNKEQPSVKLKIQFFSAEPDSNQRLRVDRELRDIIQNLRDGEHRESFDELPEPRMALRSDDIQKFFRRGRAHIIHFAGHGEASGHLVLEGAAGKPERMSPDFACGMFKLWNDDGRARCVVLNACHSHILAKALAEEHKVVPCAIGTTDVLVDGAALRFAGGFYSAIADGVPFGKAFEAGKLEVLREHPSQAEIFRCYVADPSLLDKPLMAQ